MTKRLKYYERVDGGWFDIGRVWYLRCCDCNLVHQMTLRVRKGRLELRGDRDKRRTAQCRRHARKPKG